MNFEMKTKYIKQYQITFTIYFLKTKYKNSYLKNKSEIEMIKLR